jgi:glycine/D-amino acid oxidase-like deaminating enzyme
LRPLSPDNLPFLGEPPGYEGLMLAAGHSRLGILLSGATCKIVADLITTGTTDFPLEPFSPTRFESEKREARSEK